MLIINDVNQQLTSFEKRRKKMLNAFARQIDVAKSKFDNRPKWMERNKLPQLIEILWIRFEKFYWNELLFLFELSELKIV